MKNLHLLSALHIILIVGACRPPQFQNNFDYGLVESNQYTNEFFGCSIDLPADWVVQSREQMEKLQNLGKEMIAGEDKKFKKELKVSDIRSANLLTVFKFELGSTVEFNPNISIVAENVKFSPGIKSGADYLNHSRKLLEQSQFKYDSISTNFDRVNFSGKVFSRMYTSVNYKGIPITQEYYSAIISGFSFNLVISYSDEEQKKELEGILGTLRFE
jgi:flagellar biosynthesis regulator FlaF